MYYENIDTVGGDEWRESLDAVAAPPEHHKVIFENRHVRELDTPKHLAPLRPHSIRNVGDRGIRAISVEIKDRAI